MALVIAKLYGLRYVQGDSGEVNILSSDSIGHCEEIRVIAD